MPTFPHCPNPDCKYFHSDDIPKYDSPPWFRRWGSYNTETFGIITRYRCLNCRSTFSSQSFSIDYYAKKRIDYSHLLEHLVSCSGLWDIARFIGCSVDVIQNRFERLARCCIAIHSDILGKLPFIEQIAMDGFESFSYSQYFPNNINIIAGSDSEFLYAMGLSILRRKGKMTDQQKVKRQRMENRGRADPASTQKSIQHILDGYFSRLTQRGIDAVTLNSDEHNAYSVALSKCRGQNLTVDHIKISSKERRTQDNPLFPVNYCDRQFRKDMSDHVRETVQFAKSPSAMMSRMAVYQFAHNCLIPRRIREYRRGKGTTHVQKAGLSQFTLNKIVSRRMGTRPFMSKLEVDREAECTWFGSWMNPGQVSKKYIPKYIAA